MNYLLISSHSSKFPLTTLGISMFTFITLPKSILTTSYLFCSNSYWICYRARLLAALSAELSWLSSSALFCARLWSNFLCSTSLYSARVSAASSFMFFNFLDLYEIIMIILCFMHLLIILSLLNHVVDLLLGGHQLLHTLFHA